MFQEVTHDEAGSTASRRIGNLAFLKRPIHQWGPPPPASPREGATYATVQGLNYTRLALFPFAVSPAGNEQGISLQKKRVPSGGTDVLHRTRT